MTEAGKPFFSIIVPAHNEESYIADTLRHAAALAYPRDRFEVIVVENGSTDSTLAKAEAFAAGPVRILSIVERGVAKARNRGMDEASPGADWLVFLDADTHLAPSFLAELALFLSNDTDGTLAVGGTSVAPFPASWFANCWYRFYDGVHELFKHTATLTVARAALARETRFNEDLAWMEDFRFVEALRTRGGFFFMRTRSVTTSTRRLENDGWVRILFWQTLIGLLPVSLQRRFVYSVVR